MKCNRWLVLAALALLGMLFAPAHAAQLGVSIESIPALPLSLPSRSGAVPSSLPARTIPTAPIGLPGFELPSLPMSLPSRQVPGAIIIDGPAVRLPSRFIAGLPARAAAKKIAVLDFDGVDKPKPSPVPAEKPKREEKPKGDGSRLTLPEWDLEHEIGVH